MLMSMKTTGRVADDWVAAIAGGLAHSRSAADHGLAATHRRSDQGVDWHPISIPAIFPILALIPLDLFHFRPPCPIRYRQPWQFQPWT